LDKEGNGFEAVFRMLDKIYPMISIILSTIIIYIKERDEDDRFPAVQVPQTMPTLKQSTTSARK